MQYYRRIIWGQILGQRILKPKKQNAASFISYLFVRGIMKRTNEESKGHQA